MLKILVVERDEEVVEEILFGISDAYPKSVDICGDLPEMMRRLSDSGAGTDILILGPSSSAPAGLAYFKARGVNPELAIIGVLPKYSPELHRAVVEAGADDVVSHDRLPAGLDLRLLPICRALTMRKLDKAQLSAAKLETVTAISSVGELGVVLEFLRKSFRAESAPELAKLVVEAAEAYGLTGIVRVEINKSGEVYSREGTGIQSEVAMMSNAMRMGRVFELSDRGAYNFGKVSLLVSGMPKQDAVRRDRIRANLVLLAEAAEVRAAMLEAMAVEEQRAKTVYSAQKSLYLNLKQAERIAAKRDSAAVSLVAQFKAQMEANLMGLALTAEQESRTMEVVHDYTERLTRLLNGEGEVLTGLAELAVLLGEAA